MSPATPVISLCAIGKKFRLARQPTRSLKQTLIQWAHGKRQFEHFVALDNVSLEISGGESVGVIGSNGSGKSTLFKIISEIILPTCGELKVQGQISPLIELSAGFHPELTGIENVYLNGAVYGLTRSQINQKLGAIADFADIGDFIYSPVRVYSSGMLARLGFALAVHVDADILLIDEVLSVGDHIFQQRCLTRIHELNQKGVTIVFVSHDMNAVRSISKRVVWLDHGIIQADGKPDEVIAAYTKPA